MVQEVSGLTQGHLTTQGVGFVDEVPDDEVTVVADTVRKLLADAEPVRVRMGPAVIDPEVVRLRVNPVDALVPVRRAIRTAITQVRGTDRLMEDDTWNPHVSVAYSNTDGPMAPLAAAITEGLPPVNVRINEVQLIVLGRDEYCYTWTTRDRVPLGR
jgi:2'-5' RNA ligase superfamily